MASWKQVMKSTKKVLISMLKENTGCHMLDSGGAYGRNWERNQTRDFDSEPEVFLCANSWDVQEKEGKSVIEGNKIEMTINLYHWLKYKLAFDNDMDRKWRGFANRKENKRECGLSLVEPFIEELKERGHEVENVYTENSYNYDNLLSQVIQYTSFTCDDVQYILLSIHGGCDVRGGYTMPRVFTPQNDEFYCDWSIGGISVTDGFHRWYGEYDGFKSESYEDEKQLTLDGSANIVNFPNLADLEFEVQDEKTILCPLDGKPLEAYLCTC